MTATMMPTSRNAPHAAATHTHENRRGPAGIRNDRWGSSAGSAAYPVSRSAAIGFVSSVTFVFGPSAPSGGGATNFVPHARQTTAMPASPSGNRIDFPHDVHRTL